MPTDFDDYFDLENPPEFGDLRDALRKAVARLAKLEEFVSDIAGMNPSLGHEVAPSVLEELKEEARQLSKGV